MRSHRPPKYNKCTIYIYIEDFILAIFWSNTMQIVAQIYQRRENLRFCLRPKYTQIYKRPKYTSLTLALPPSPRSSDRCTSGSAQAIEAAVLASRHRGIPSAAALAWAGPPRGPPPCRPGGRLRPWPLLRWPVGHGCRPEAWRGRPPAVCPCGPVCVC